MKLPAGKRRKLFVQLREIGDALAMKIKGVEPMQKFIAGAPRQYFGLALIERRPDAMLGLAVALEPLRNRPVRVCAWGKLRFRKNSHGLCPSRYLAEIWCRRAGLPVPLALRQSFPARLPWRGTGDSTLTPIV